MSKDPRRLFGDSGGPSDFKTHLLAYHHPEWHPVSREPRPRLSVNILLFAATILTTTMAGAVQKGLDPLASLSDLLQGLPFSTTLLGILLFHELGHYFVSRFYNVPASLPYFIPVPTLIGTMGAVIKMRSPIHDRRTLFDIGIAGPIAGMCLAVPAVIVGLSRSELIPVEGGLGGIELGDSLLFMALTKLVVGTVPEGHTVLLHPVAFAGWLGFFVTSLNLLPMGQLDGGHVVYGIFGQGHRLISRVVFLGLTVWGLHAVFLRHEVPAVLWALAFLLVALRIAWTPRVRPAGPSLLVMLLLVGVWQGFAPDTSVWLVWAALMTFLKLDHPPTWDARIPLGTKRLVAGWIALLVFIATFTPLPFKEIPH
jgi:membrane-associated protease RseP (regulator of RpoE activity)